MPIELIAAPHTPFNSHGELRLEVIEQQAAHFGSSYVSGAFICGSTGEGVSLTIDERMRMAEAWVTAARPRGLKVLVHAGHNCSLEATKLAGHAARIGADGVAVMAPSYFKPHSVEALLDYLAPIADSCADLPFYFYDIPSMTGVRQPSLEMLQGLTRRISNFAGIKYTKDDLVELQECLSFADGRWAILFGCDEILLSGYLYGARGAVGSTYNFVPQLYHKMIAAFDVGKWDEARRLQLLSVRIVRTCQRYGYAAAAKSAMRLLDIDCGPVRTPLSSLTEERQQKLLDELKPLWKEI